MGPFNTPWMTFAAWLVAGACIAAAVVWAVFLFKPEDGDDE